MHEFYTRFSLPLFSDAQARWYGCGDGAEMLLYGDVTEADARAYAAALAAAGFTPADALETPGSFCALLRHRWTILTESCG